MGTCKCGYSTDPEKNCNGTHKVVAAVKADLATKLAEKGFNEAAEFVKEN
jgi:CDGSH-type Zn-finger protein